MLREAVDLFWYVAIVTNSTAVECGLRTMPLTSKAIRLLQTAKPDELGVISSREKFAAAFPISPTSPQDCEKQMTKWKELAFKFIAESVGFADSIEQLIVVFGDGDQEVEAGKELQTAYRNSLLKIVKCPKNSCPKLMGSVIRTFRTKLDQLRVYNVSQEWAIISPIKQ